MTRTTKYVALDVHQASTVASVREESGRVIARRVLPTESSAIGEFFRGLRGAVHVTFEEGTQAQWLHELVAPLVDRVIVCDRRGEPQPGNKGDLVDADRLSELLRRGGLRAVYHGNAPRTDLKELTRTYGTLVEDSFKRMLGRARAPTQADPYDAYHDANNPRRERQESEKAWTDRIRVGIGPESKTGRSNDEEQRTAAEDKHAEAHLDQPRSEVFAHPVLELWGRDLTDRA